MAFPEDSLSGDEEVRLHLRPHWIVVFWPAVFAVITIGGVAAAGIFWLETAPVAVVAVGAVGLVLFVWLSLAPFIVWRSTHYAFTTQQVLLRRGVLRRVQRGMPLSKVNNVLTTQGLLDRILRSGTLTIESAGEDFGRTVLVRVPQAIDVSTLVRELAEEHMDRHTLDEEELRAALKEHREAGGTL